MKKGFSLIELIISLAIISFIVLVLSNLFSLNINTLNRSYEDEKEYKQAYTAMAYMDNTLRMSHKIEVAANKDSNFNAFIYRSNNNNGYRKMCYNFYSKDGFLYVHSSDESKDSNGTNNKISECGPINLQYDEMTKIIKINLTSKNGRYNFETAIYVGDKKLWKRPL